MYELIHAKSAKQALQGINLAKRIPKARKKAKPKMQKSQG